MIGLAAAQGVELEAFATCVNSEASSKKVQADIASGVAAGVSGTPTTILVKPDGTSRKLLGTLSLDELSANVANFN